MHHRYSANRLLLIIRCITEVSLLMIAGCSTKKPLPETSPEKAKVKSISFPKVRDVNTAQLGDRLVADGHRRTE